MTQKYDFMSCLISLQMWALFYYGVACLKPVSPVTQCDPLYNWQLWLRIITCVCVTAPCLCNVINRTPLYRPHLSHNAQFYRELTQVFIGLCNKSTPAPRRSHKIILFGRRDKSVSVSLASEQPSLNLSLSLSTEDMCVSGRPPCVFVCANPLLVCFVQTLQTGEKIVGSDNRAFLLQQMYEKGSWNDKWLWPKTGTDRQREKKMYSLEITCGWQGAPCCLSVRLNVVMWICVWCINRENARGRTERTTNTGKHIFCYFFSFSYSNTHRFSVISKGHLISERQEFSFSCTYKNILFDQTICVLLNIFICGKKKTI